MQGIIRLEARGVDTGGIFSLRESALLYALDLDNALLYVEQGLRATLSTADQNGWEYWNKELRNLLDFSKKGVPKDDVPKKSIGEYFDAFEKIKEKYKKAAEENG